MSTSHRFFIKTARPRQVEALIIETLGGSGWLYKDAAGRLLRPLSVLREDHLSIRPARDVCRNLVSLDPQPEAPHSCLWRAFARLFGRSPNIENTVATCGELPTWYWLNSMIHVHSPEAAALALALYESRDVETVAEDNEVSGDDEEAVATVISPNHHLVQSAIAASLVS